MSKRTKITTLEGFNRDAVVNFKQIYSDPLIKLKKYDEAYTLLGASLDKNGFPATGLTEDYKEPTIGSKMPKKVQGTRRALEILLDLTEGTLKNNSSYWNTFQLRIGSEALTWNLRDNMDLLKYLFALGQSIVCDGLVNIAQDSKVEYVIFSEDQEAAGRVTGRKSLKKAYNLAEELDIETKVNILATYGILVDASNVNSIIDKIDEQIETDAEEFLIRANDGFLVTRSLVSKALDAAVLTMEDGAIYHGEVILGYDRQSAAENLAKNEVLQKIIKAKMSGDMAILKEAMKTENGKTEDKKPVKAKD
jgi:hypothetical protein